MYVSLILVLTYVNAPARPRLTFQKPGAQPAFFCRAGARAGFFASRGSRCGSRASFCGCLPAMGSSISRCPSIRLRGFFGCAGPSPEACTLRRNASIRLITLRGSAAASLGYGNVGLLLARNSVAPLVVILELDGSKSPAFVSRMCSASFSISAGTLRSGISSKYSSAFRTS